MESRRNNRNTRFVRLFMRLACSVLAATVLTFAAPLIFIESLPFSGVLTVYAENAGKYYRLDSSHPNSGLEKLKRVRFLIEGQYTLQPLGDEVNGMTLKPSLNGLDSLRISGSPEYTEQQFRELAERIRVCAGGDPVYVIDLRQESHFFVNGMPVSVYGADNTANRGLGLAEVEADEAAHLAEIRKDGLKVYAGSQKEKNAMKIQQAVCMTERELVESEGFHYLRLPATDHEWPAPELVDRFIEFVSQLDMDHVWLHFHCLAGKGRTGVYMAIYDMMKNPDVPVEDISARQAMAGSSYILKYRNNKSDSRKYDRAQKLLLMDEYLRENRDTGYRTKWSEWLKTREAAVLKDAA